MKQKLFHYVGLLLCLTMLCSLFPFIAYTAESGQVEVQSASEGVSDIPFLFDAPFLTDADMVAYKNDLHGFVNADAAGEYIFYHKDISAVYCNGSLLAPVLSGKDWIQVRLPQGESEILIETDVSARNRTDQYDSVSVPGIPADPSSFTGIISGAAAGSTIVLEKGVYKIGSTINVGNSITIRPKVPGTAIIRSSAGYGNNIFNITGSNATIKGLRFEHNAGQSISIEAGADNNRVTQNQFFNCLVPGGFGARNVILQGGNASKRGASFNRIDHNFFTMPNGMAISQIESADEFISYSGVSNLYDHNIFRNTHNMWTVNGTGYASLQLGQGPPSNTDNMFATVEYNLFDYNIEGEAVSAKAASNVFRYNVFFRNRESFWFRSAFDNVLYSNVFNKSMSSDIAVASGSRHIAANNLIIEPSVYGIVIRNDMIGTGNPNAQRIQMNDMLIANNTVVSSEITMWQEAINGSKPVINNVRVFNNLIVSANGNAGINDTATRGIRNNTTSYDFGNSPVGNTPSGINSSNVSVPAAEFIVDGVSSAPKSGIAGMELFSYNSESEFPEVGPGILPYPAPSGFDASSALLTPPYPASNWNSWWDLYSGPIGLKDIINEFQSGQNQAGTNISPDIQRLMPDTPEERGEVGDMYKGATVIYERNITHTAASPSSKFDITNALSEGFVLEFELMEGETGTEIAPKTTLEFGAYRLEWLPGNPGTPQYIDLKKGSEHIARTINISVDHRSSGSQGQSSANEFKADRMHSYQLIKVGGYIILAQKDTRYNAYQPTLAWEDINYISSGPGAMSFTHTPDMQIQNIRLYSTAGEDPATELMSHFSFDEGGGDEARDSVNPDIRLARFLNAGWTEDGYFGSSLSFPTGNINNGTVSNKFEIPGVWIGTPPVQPPESVFFRALNNNFIVEFYVRPAAETAGYRPILGLLHQGTNFTVSPWSVGLENGYPVFFLRESTGPNNGTVNKITSTEKIEIGEWAHIMAVKDSTEGMRLYVNGKIAASGQYTGPVRDITQNGQVTLIVGGGSGGDDNLPFAGGDIDELKIWKISPSTAPIPPSILTTSLTDGRLEIPYSVPLEAIGDLPILWSVTSGSLPPGLELKDNIITGVPAETGEFTFTIQASNIGDDTSKTYTIRIVERGVSTKLHAYYDFNEGSGDKAASRINPEGLDISLDRKGNAGWTADGYLGSAAYFPDNPIGYGNKFDLKMGGGTTVHPEAKYIRDVTNNFVIEAYVKPTAKTAEYRPVLGMLHDGGNHAVTSWQIGLENGKPRFFVRDDSSDAGLTYTAKSDLEIPLNEWSHIMAVKDDSKIGDMRLYVNGALVAQSTCGNATRDYAKTINSSVTFMVGGGSGGGNNNGFAGGYIDEVKLWTTDGPLRPASVITTALPDALLGETYSQELIANGDLPIVWSLINGELPEGLELKGNRISGIPAETGNFTFTVRAMNDAGADVCEMSIVINKTLSGDVSITSVAVAGIDAVTDEFDDSVYRAELPQGTVLNDLTISDIVITAADPAATVDIQMSEDGGATWSAVVTAEDRTTVKVYTIYVTAEQGYPDDKNEIVITSIENGNGQSNINFAIKSPNGKGYRLYLSTDGGVTFIGYNNVNYNAKGAHVKGLSNGQIYYAYIEYMENEEVIARSLPAELAPSK